MVGNIFVNLPVADVARTRDFFTGLGFAFNPQFSDDKALCMVLGEDKFVMLLRRDFFATFTRKPIADAATSTEVLLALQLGSRDEVDAMMETALRLGGTEARDPQDLGFMYSRAYQDPDGHIWEPFHMDPEQMPSDTTGGGP